MVEVHRGFSFVVRAKNTLKITRWPQLRVDPCAAPNPTTPLELIVLLACFERHRDRLVLRIISATGLRHGSVDRRSTPVLGQARRTPAARCPPQRGCQFSAGRGPRRRNLTKCPVVRAKRPSPIPAPSARLNITATSTGPTRPNTRPSAIRMTKTTIPLRIAIIPWWTSSKNRWRGRTC